MCYTCTRTIYNNNNNNNNNNNKVKSLIKILANETNKIIYNYD